MATRQRYFEYASQCDKGIDQRVDDVVPGTCADARNVWEHDGLLQKRPGYSGVVPVTFALVPGIPYSTHSLSPYEIDPFDVGITEDDGVFSAVSSFPVDVTGLSVGDRIYLGIANIDKGNNIGQYPVWFTLETTTNVSDGSAVDYQLEYFNGTTWKTIPSALSECPTGGLAGIFSRSEHFLTEASMDHPLYCCIPTDWSTTTLVDSTARYYIRCTITSGTITAAVATVEVEEGALVQPSYRDGYVAAGSIAVSSVCPFAAVLNFSAHKRYLFQSFSTVLPATPAIRSLDFLSLGTLLYDNVVTFDAFAHNYSVNHVSSKQGTFAVVSEFDEAFVCSGGTVTVHKAVPADTDEINALVEANPDRFGPGYGRDYIAQLGAWPEADYILYHKNRLYVADGNTIRWSAPSPWHKVWPSLSFESIPETDDNETMGMVSFGEHVVVFKENSVWIMVEQGFGPFGLLEHSLVKVVSGYGCVAHHTIKEVDDHLMFLGKDGVYSLSKSWQLQKMSDAIEPLIRKIDGGRKPYAVAAHWRLRSMYLLSVTIAGDAVNKHVLAFDYSKGAWWIWDNINAEAWLEDTDGGENEILYFIDEYGRLMQWDNGQNDFGTAITAWFETQRFGLTDATTKCFREVRCTTAGNAGTLTLELITDGSTTDSTTGTITTADINDTTARTLGEARKVKMSYRSVGDYGQLKITHAVKDAPFFIRDIKVRGYRKGIR